MNRRIDRLPTQEEYEEDARLEAERLRAWLRHQRAARERPRTA